MKDLIKENKLILFVASFVGLVVILPQILFIYNLGLEYKGIYMMGSDAETHYLARMQEFYDDNSIGNPFIYEYKSNVPTGFYSLAEPILAFPGYVLGISTVNTSLFYKFLLPFVASILVYFLFLAILGDKWWSIAGALTVMLGGSLINTPELINFLSWNKIYTGFISYARPINPQFSSILFFVYLYNLFKAFTVKDNKYFYYLLFVFGISFYIYFYSFTFIFALNFVFILLSYFVGEKETAKKMGYVLFFGCAIGLPAIFSILSMMGHPLYADYAKLMGVTSSHSINISSAWVIVTLLFLWNLLKKEKQKTDYYILGLIVTSFLVVNQQVFTGIVLQEGHYHWYFNTPIFIISLFWILWKNFGTLKNKFVYFGLFLVCIIAILDASFIQISSYEYWNKKVISEQKYADIFVWLNKNTQKEDVVFANEGISKYIPVYTSNNVVWEDHASFYLMPKERRDFTQENLLKNFSEENLKRYRIDYFVADKKIDNLSVFENAKFLSAIYEDDNFGIYAYKN